VKDTLRASLHEGRPSFGSWLQSGNAAIAEVMARAGFEWLAIDLEHSAIDLETAEARQAVEAVNYPPHGTRGVGLGRAHGYGPRFAEYFVACHERSVVIPMIEQAEGVEQVEHILQVAGVDGVFIGPYDLSASYGVAGELHHPLVQSALRRVVAAARTAGKAAGIHVVHPPVTQVADRLSEGFRLIAYGGDMLFVTAAAIDAGAALQGLGVRE
jgi:2-dehydro-3-deoxyglucarate aldolase